MTIALAHSRSQLTGVPPETPDAGDNGGKIKVAGSGSRVSIPV